MPANVTLTLDPDEAEIIIDALDTAVESQEDARDDARANTDRAAVAAAEQEIARLNELKARFQALIDE
jgi:hypothetical protein